MATISMIMVFTCIFMKLVGIQKSHTYRNLPNRGGGRDSKVKSDTMN